MKNHRNIKISKVARTGRKINKILAVGQPFEGYPITEICSGYSERKGAGTASELQVYINFLDKHGIPKIWDIYARCVRLGNGDTTSSPEPFFRESWHVDHFG